MSKVIVEISSRHCHLSRKDLDAIYGKNYQLKQLKPLSQTGQFAAIETVAIKSGNNLIKNVRILGPVRKNSQVEISKTESYKLKINPPITEHVNPKKTKGCAIAEIIGPKGKVKRCAVIIARRHFHVDPVTAKKLGLKNKQIISIKTSGQRGVTFHNVLTRIDPSFKPRIHLDTDEGNAAGLKGGEKVEVII